MKNKRYGINTKHGKKTSVYKSLRKNYFFKLPKNFELHHWNYNDEYLKDVFIIDRKDHRVLHNSLFLDLEKKLFYLKDGTYLDTKEKHENFIKSQKIQIENYERYF